MNCLDDFGVWPFVVGWFVFQWVIKLLKKAAKGNNQQAKVDKAQRRQAEKQAKRQQYQQRQQQRQQQQKQQRQHQQRPARGGQAASGQPDLSFLKNAFEQLGVELPEEVQKKLDPYGYHDKEMEDEVFYEEGHSFDELGSFDDDPSYDQQASYDESQPTWEEDPQGERHLHVTGARHASPVDHPSDHWAERRRGKATLGPLDADTLRDAIILNAAIGGRRKS